MKRSPQEQSAIEAYKKKYQNEGLSKSSIGSYLGALSARGTLTKAVQQAGLLPEGTESLLTLQDLLAIEAIQSWWVQEGHLKHTRHKTAMNKWLTDWGQDGAKRKTPKRALQPPPYGIQLHFLLRAFAQGLEHAEPWVEMETVLQILTLNDTLSTTKEHYREHTFEFRQLRETILYQMENWPDKWMEKVCRNLLHHYQAPQMMRACRHAVYSCLEVWGCSILRELEQTSIPYEDSIWKALACVQDALNTPPGADTIDTVNTAFRCFSSLLHRILTDCDPALYPINHKLVPGQTLSDPRFWDSHLLWSWLTAKELSPELLHLLLRLTPVGSSNTSRFHLYLFHRIWQRTRLSIPNPPQKELEEAEAWVGKLLVYLELHWDTLKPVLSTKNTDWWQTITEEQLMGGQAHCLLRAELLVQQAELATDCGPNSARPIQRGYRIMQAQESLRQAQKIMEHLTDQKLYLFPHIKPLWDRLWIRLYLCQAKLYPQMAIQETTECSLGDVVRQYITPARIALEQAAVRVNRHRDTWHPLWKSTYQACVKTFFHSHSPVIYRTMLRSPEDTNYYHQEFETWKHLAPDDTASLTVPTITRRWDATHLPDASQFSTVYCGVFDSTMGKDPKHRQAIELMLFQMLASGKVCLLQLNQIVDNRAMLGLLPTPGFRQACREGIISLSCYGGIHSPREYLLHSLYNPKFYFSSSSLYELPRNADQAQLESSFRQAMITYLEQRDPSAFRLAAAPIREEVEFLTDSYEILFDCFKPSDLLRFHQNAAVRTPPCPSWERSYPIRSLNEVIHERLGQLLHEAQQGDPTKNLELLQALACCEEKWNHPLMERSHYETAIQEAWTQAQTQDERLLLTKFRKLVNQCYFLSNGRRSCKTVLLTETDPDLIQTKDFTREHTPGLDVLSHIFRQKYRPADDSNLSWPDLCEIALTIRDIDRDESACSAEELARRKGQYTGLNYTVSGNETLLSAFTPKISTGQVIAVSKEERPENVSEVLEIHEL